jgi:CRP-like cAMP-binding protein
VAVTDFSNYFRHAKHLVELGAGDVLFRQGEQGEVMYGLLDGEMDVQVNGVSVDSVRPGQLIGEMAIVDAGPRSATLIASTACRLAQVDRRQFLFMVHEAPTFAIDVMREFAERLRHWHARTNEA